MNVTVRYHGIIGDMLRRKTQQVEMPDGATVTDLVAMVTRRRRGRQADRSAPLADGAEVIFMRPSAGGETIYFDAVDPAGRLSPPVCGSGCPPGARIAQRALLRCHVAASCRDPAAGQETVHATPRLCAENRCDTVPL